MANVKGADGGPKDGENGDGRGVGKEKKTRQESYISIGDMSEPTIHTALESTASPIVAVISISIEDDLLGSKSRGSSHDICSSWGPLSRFMMCCGEKESSAYDSMPRGWMWV